MPFSPRLKHQCRDRSLNPDGTPRTDLPAPQEPLQAPQTAAIDWLDVAPLRESPRAPEPVWISLAPDQEDEAVELTFSDPWEDEEDEEPAEDEKRAEVRRWEREIAAERDCARTSRWWCSSGHFVAGRDVTCKQCGSHGPHHWGEDSPIARSPERRVRAKARAKAWAR